MKYTRLSLLDVENIPAELSDYDSWICWREDPPRTPLAKPSKTPIAPKTLVWAHVNEPADWTSRDVAVAAYKRRKELTGIGFVFSDRDPYVGIDLDNCRNQETGKMEDWAVELVRLMN